MSAAAPQNNSLLSLSLTQYISTIPAASALTKQGKPRGAPVTTVMVARKACAGPCGKSLPLWKFYKRSDRRHLRTLSAWYSLCKSCHNTRVTENAAKRKAANQQ